MKSSREKKPLSGDEIVNLPAEGDPQLSRALLHAMRNAGISVLYQGPDLKTIWARNMLNPWVSDGRPGHNLPSSQAERLNAARRNVVATGNPERLEISLANEIGVRWFDVWIDADRGEDGTVQGVVTTKIDITEQKRREQTLKTLLREVSHRSKNLLAIIQSIASQTGRYSEGISDFLTRFRGRLQSLSSSQDLVTSSNWRGAELRTLVSDQVARYVPNPAHGLRFEGANPYLNPNAALHIGLAVHELAVNSVSYGALSQPDGYVEVRAQMAPGNDEIPNLSVMWSEAIGVPSSRLPARRRFGSVALERVVPVSLNGTAELSIAEGRLEYRLNVPHGNFEAE